MSKNLFFSLEIRDINFDYDKYYLSLEDKNNFNNIFITNEHIIKNDENEELPADAISNITSYTVVPKFLIDKISSPLLYQIFNIDYDIINKKEEKEIKKNDEDNKDNKDNKEKDNKNIINIEKDINEGDNIIIEENIDNINKNSNENKNNKKGNIKELKIDIKSYTTKEIICSFNVRNPLFPEYYNYLGKSSDQFKILQFPCIIMQSELGYYALKKIVKSKKNNELEEEINLAIQVNEDSFFETLFTNRQKPMPKKKKKTIDFDVIMQNKVYYDSTISSLKDKKQELINKKKELKSLIEKRKKILEEKKNILSYNKILENNKNSWNRFVTLKEILTKINAYTTEIISIKEKKISSCNTEIEKYQKDIEKKRNKEIPHLKKINKGVIITNYLLYKYALNEICYFFFNKNINIYNFPSFYKINLTDLNNNKKMVENYYNKYNKEVSALFGNIIFLLNYLSKKFDIILPYNLYYNGSKSMAFISMGGKSLCIDLYMKENERNVLSYGKKNEDDIQLKIEILSNMIFDIIMFFYSKKICSDKFNVENISGGKKNRNNLYINFMKLNELFKDILNKMEKK